MQPINYLSNRVKNLIYYSLIETLAVNLCIHLYNYGKHLFKVSFGCIIWVKSRCGRDEYWNEKSCP